MVYERCEFHRGDAIDGKYLVEKALGEGTFGSVYKVRDTENRVCALKLLKLWTVPPEACKNLTDRFVMEFETARIQSNYLVHSYTYGQVYGNPYMLMEFCPNGDLRSYVASGNIDYVTVASDVLCGLRDLHSHGKVHRDLKPENVLLRSDNTAVLTDFGISGDQNKRMTERGWLGKPTQIFGTYPYMPPEQVNPPRGGRATVLPTTDIFSFGVMMYEMIVGTLPFGELTEATLGRYLENGKNGRWDRSALKCRDSKSIWTPIIEGCLVPDFKTRIQNTEQVLQMLPQRERQPEDGFLRSAIYTICNGVLLRVMQGEEYGKTYKLNDFLSGYRRIVTLGRYDESVQNSIAIRDKDCYISRCHCTLEQDTETGGWYIRDGQFQKGSGWKKSLNGTYVNSSEVDEMGMPIYPGDIISIGDVKLRVEGY